MVDMTEARKKSYEVLGRTVCRVLNSHGFNAQYVPDGKGALDAALKLIPKGASVGVPGTVTIREIGLIPALEERGSKVAVHWDPDLKPEDMPGRFMEQLTSDWFVTSTNALSVDEGVFVNIDGSGNRIGAMSWAPGKLLIIAGINKLAPDTASALRRVRDKATPPNVIRLDGDAPCGSVGHCINCSSPGRVCRIVMMMERPPMGRECHVIIAGEDLGY
ncbi:MAG: lactate utilization protein [Synergistaceae bacterium]|nr:lactate utilization protein [Synergistaceae bacterium]